MKVGAELKRTKWLWVELVTSVSKYSQVFVCLCLWGKREDEYRDEPTPGTMESFKSVTKSMHIYICMTGYFAAQLKLAQHCKSTIL